MTDTRLKTQNLTKQFGKFVAVDGVDLELVAGETRALIGPNGAGKTTFQNLISGDLDVTEGSITFEGTDITNMSPYERARMGMIRKYQENHIYDSETVVENMRMAARGDESIRELMLREDDEVTEDRIDELLQIANLYKKRETVASQLSHGEQQWLEIMMCVLADPTLLVLDEPTSGMSVHETNDTVDLLQEIKQTEDISLLVVEHDMEFIKKVSNNITVLHRGRIIAEGTIEEVQNDEQVRDVYLEGG
ncbi:ABC transporter ATP-binding protein [Natronomonas gomsonensis]|uniref:ABC transporter ATP-binding protein n=1 Tax=Natronomonas gomsonensis TaxID=1046043 RepID=UPI00227BF8E4|nr:ABC transporter ATP-binding protein [Natronomonas gomsonensis]MCY4732731.1 ABC transporter ATP-binding protein [Natronomonas gomsonensis]